MKPKPSTMKQASLFTFFTKSPQKPKPVAQAKEVEGGEAASCKATSTKSTNHESGTKEATGGQKPSVKNVIDVKVGDEISVYWPDDETFYPGTITKQRDGDNKVFIVYQDGETEWIDLRQHQYRKEVKMKEDKRKRVEETVVESPSPAKAAKKTRVRIEDDDEEEFEFDNDIDDDDGSVFDPKGTVEEKDDEEEIAGWMSCDEEDDQGQEEPVEKPVKKKSRVTKVSIKHHKPSSSSTSENISQFASSRSTSGSVSVTPKKRHDTLDDSAQEGPSVYTDGAVNPRGSHVHNHLAFIRNPKDARGRPQDHPDYDPRTLKVVLSDWTKHVKKMTNAVQQWWDLKAQYYDTVLLFKTGKFYEMFHMDADVGVKILGLTYMKGIVAHAGFPEIRYGANADKLVRAGYKVARVEQTETPQMLAERKKEHRKGSGAPKPQVVNREVCSILTLGTRTFCYLDDKSGLTQDVNGAIGPLLAIREILVESTDDSNFDEDSMKPVCEYGITLVDAVRATVTIGQFADDVLRSRMNTLLSSCKPSEILLEDGEQGASPVLRSLVRSFERLSNEPMRTEFIRQIESFPKSTALDAEAKKFLERKPQVHPWDVEETLHELHRRGYYPRASRQNSDSVSRWPKVLKAAVEGKASLALSSFGAVLFYLQRGLIDGELLSMGNVCAYVPSSAPSNIDETALEENRPNETDEAGAKSDDAAARSHNISTQFGKVGMSGTPEDHITHLSLDGTTLHNLEIQTNSVNYKVSGSLLSKINHTKTPHGERLFRAWLLRPLFRKADIERRQDAVAELVSGPGAIAMEEASGVLRKVGDLERLLSRIHSMSGKRGEESDSFHPSDRAVMYEGATYTKRKVTDFSRILGGLRKAAVIPELFSDVDVESSLLKNVVKKREHGGCFPELNDRLDWYYDNCDIDKAMKGQFDLNRGTNSDYDDACDAEKDVLQNLEDYKREMLGELPSSAKSAWKYTNTKPDSKDKYMIELPASIEVPSEFILKGKRGTGQKRVNKYRTAVLDELVAQLNEAIDMQKNQRARGLQVLFSRFVEERNIWEAASHATAMLDALGSLAKTASMSGYTRPVILDCPPGVDPSLKIIQGRHPCIDSPDFVPNDLVMGQSDDGGARVMLLSGPNMGGKSTLLRQTCLIAILAQIGSYVPAETCELTPVDTIFTRLGASDRLLLGQSTFFLEAAETAAALRGATRRSLVIMDELGRGTSTHDGTAIAGGTIQYLVNHNRCLALFATHYHSLLDDFKSFPNVRLGHMACIVEGDEPESDGEPAKRGGVVFLYNLGEGTCPKSFGINVARLAGLPEEVLRNAKKHSSDFEDEVNQTTAITKRNQYLRSAKERILALIKSRKTDELKKLQAELKEHLRK